jgi:hypothetical protein
MYPYRKIQIIMLGDGHDFRKILTSQRAAHQDGPYNMSDVFLKHLFPFSYLIAKDKERPYPYLG